MKKDLISIKDLEPKEIREIFELTDKLKKNSASYTDSLKNKTLALIFQKPSNRTRVSFSVGMTQLGGNYIYLGPDELKLGVRESAHDVAKVLSRYLDGIVARTFSHKEFLELAKSADIPVINGLTDLYHPCQGLTDLYTIKKKKGASKEIKISYVGDGNNVLHSLLLGASKLGMKIFAATPKGYEPKKEIVNEAKKFASKSEAEIHIGNNPTEAAEDSDCIYTDVWASMGKESEHKKRLKDFKNFQVNDKLISLAKPDCIIMHCLPAHRGEEITDEVIDGQNSVVFDQAENRLHVQKAILIKLMGAES